MTHTLSRIATRLAAFGALAGAVLVAPPAKAWVVFGLPPVVIGPPVVPYAPYPPGYYYDPGYYPAPYAYPPPPASSAPPAAQQPAQPQMSQSNTPYGTMCYAGVYTCAAPYASHVGTTCACSVIGAPSYGTVR